MSLLSVLSFLAWALLVTVGIGGLLFEKFVPIGGVLAAFYCWSWCFGLDGLLRG